jgi:hypothetical protein
MLLDGMWYGYCHICFPAPWCKGHTGSICWDLTNWLLDHHDVKCCIPGPIHCMVSARDGGDIIVLLVPTGSYISHLVYVHSLSPHTDLLPLEVSNLFMIALDCTNVFCLLWMSTWTSAAGTLSIQCSGTPCITWKVSNLQYRLAHCFG